MRRHVLSVSLFVVVLSGGAASGAWPQAQELALRGPRFIAAWRPSGKEVDGSNAVMLRRRVSLDLANVTVDKALKEITRQADLEISYSKAMLPNRKSVSLHVREITVAAALTEVLLDAGVDVAVARAGHLALVKRQATADVPAVDAGAVAGRVTDKATGAPIVDATVTLDPKGQNVATDNDGWYRFAGLAPGDYAVRVRSIGYAPAQASIRIAADEQAVLNVALERSVTVLEEVVSTGTASPAQVRDLPSPVTVIDGDDIEALQPRSINTLLRAAVPTAVAWDQGAQPQRTALSLRGAASLETGSGQVKIYLDGVELSDRNFGAVDPSSIDRIEIVRGPQAAALYGSDAIGGVMQIFTKRGDPSRTHPQVTAQAALGAVQSPYPESGATRQDYRLAVSGGAGEATYHFGGSFAKSGDWVTEGGSVVPSAFVGIRLPGGPLTVDISGRFYAQRIGAPLNPALYTAGFPLFSQPFHLTTQYQEQTLGTRVRYAAATWWHHSLNAGFDRITSDAVQDRPRFTTPDDSLLLHETGNTNKAFIGYNSSVTGPVGRDFVGTATVGFDHYELRTNGWFTVGAQNARGTIITDVPPSVSRDVVHNTGYFAEMRLVFRDALAITGGGRFEQHSEFGDALGTPFSPRVGVAYSHRAGSADIKLRGAYGEAIRPPTPGLKDPRLTPFNVQLANPNLRPERQSGWDAGIDIVFGALGSLGMTYFDQIAKDLIQGVTVDPLATPQVLQFQNLARVRNRGVEVEGTVRIGSVRVRGQYAYTQSRPEELGVNVGGDLRVGEQLFNIPRHTAGASVTTWLFQGTSLTGAMSYVGSWRFYDIIAQVRCFGGTGPCAATSRDFLVNYPALTKIDLSVTQDLTARLSGFATLENVTNSHRSEQANNTVTMGRVTMFGLRARL